MKQQPDWKDLDYLAARVHGRRSKMAEGSRLDRLCQIRTLPELSRALELPPEASPLVLQRRLVEDMFAELSELTARLPGPAGGVLDWMRVRFQVENLKVLARGMATGRAPEALEPYLLPLPKDLRLPAPNGSADILAQVPDGPLRDSLAEMDASDRAAPHTFQVEAALDRGYLREYRRRAGLIRGSEGACVMPLVGQEIDTFHLGLAARGIWIHHLDPDRLLPFRVDGASFSPMAFAALLRAPDLVALAQLARGKGIDEAPATIEEPDVLESLAWSRLLRLANRAFRHSHIGVGAVVAFTLLRRVELANLITLSEGIRAGIPPATLRARLIPRVLTEAAHV